MHGADAVGGTDAPAKQGIAAAPAAAEPAPIMPLPTVDSSAELQQVAAQVSAAMGALVASGRRCTCAGLSELGRGGYQHRYPVR